MLKDVGIDQKLNDEDPAGPARSATSADRRSRSASTSGSGRCVLALVYYECPMLCTQVLNGLVGSLEGIAVHGRQGIRGRRRELRPGRDAGAARPSKKQFFLKRYGRPEADAAVHFLTGREASIKRADGGRRVPLRLRCADRSVRASGGDHDPHGRRARLALPLRDRVRAARPEARARRSGRRQDRTLVDQMLLFCYHYDPETGQVRARDHEPGPAGRRADRDRARRVDFLEPAARAPPAERGPRRPQRVPARCRLLSPCSPRARRRSRRRWTCSISSSPPCARSSRCWSRRWSCIFTIKYRRRRDPTRWARTFTDRSRSS